MTSFLDITNDVLSRVNETQLNELNFAQSPGPHLNARNGVLDSIDLFNQEAYEWPFNHRTGTITTVSGQRTYDLPSDYKVIDPDTFFVRADSANDIESRVLEYIEYEEWHSKYRERDANISSGIPGTGQAISRPSRIYKTQDDKIGLTPVPDRELTVEYEYWVNPTKPVNATDDIGIPAEFDHIIVQGALYYVYMYRDNLEQARESQRKFRRLLSNARSIDINDMKYIYDTRVSRGSRRRLIRSYY